MDKMYKIWKRLWIPVIALALTIIGFLLTDYMEEDAAGAIGAISLFVFFPFFLVSLPWTIVKSIRQKKRIEQGIESLSDVSVNSFSITFKSLASHFKKEKSEYDEMNSYMRVRLWKFRAIGVVIMALGVWAFIPLTEAAIVIGTIIFILGLAAFIYPKMNSYSDLLKQIPLDKPSNIEELFQTLKDYKTPLGTPSLVRMKFMKTPAIVIGPDPSEYYIYCYFNKDGRILNIGETFINTVTEVIAESSEKFEGINEDEYTTNDILCWNSSIWLLMQNLFDALTEYFKTGILNPLKSQQKAKVYTFDEQFKLLGQKFHVCDTEQNVVYNVEGTAPLVSISVKNPATDFEEFKMVKQIDKILTTYNFYKDGKHYATFHKDPNLYRDIFVMDTPDGKFELKENTAFFGANYTVKLNDELIGTIMDDVSLTIRNFVFDNSVIYVYNDKYTALMAAMAVMVAREIARDRNNSSSSSDSED